MIALRAVSVHSTKPPDAALARLDLLDPASRPHVTGGGPNLWIINLVVIVHRKVTTIKTFGNHTLRIVQDKAAPIATLKPPRRQQMHPLSGSGCGWQFGFGAPGGNQIHDQPSR